MVAEQGRLRLQFDRTPAAVAVAQYALLSLARTHAPSMADMEDVRLALDEVLFALPPDAGGPLVLELESDEHHLTAALLVPGGELQLDPVVRALVDELVLEPHPDGHLVRLTRRWG